MLDNNDDITDYNNSGNYDEIKKGKRRRISYYDGDNDGMPDEIEENLGIHRNGKHVKHFNVGGNLGTNSAGIMVFNHQHLQSYKPRKNKKGTMSLTMPTPRKIPLSINMKNPLLNLTMREIKIPRTTLDDKKIKTNCGSYEMKHLEAFLKKVSEKKKRKGLFQW